MLQEQRLSARTWLAQFQAVQQEAQWENILKNLSEQLCISELAGTLLNQVQILDTSVPTVLIVCRKGEALGHGRQKYCKPCSLLVMFHLKLPSILAYSNLSKPAHPSCHCKSPFP